MMENHNSSTTRLAMLTGLYLGLAMILVSVIFYVSGHPFSNVSGYLMYLLIIAGISWTMKIYRDQNPQIGMTYGKALGLGTLQSLFSSFILSFFIYVLFKLIDPTLMEKFLAFLEEQLLKSGTSENQVETVMAMYKKIMTPAIYALGQIFSLTFIGFLFSLVLAIFFKKPASNPFYELEEEEKSEN